ncbi:MAG TPA: hypothetical protein PKU69_02305 [Bacillota bacterium]|nr:hypothetical protein [Bacillota bacterium]
MKKKFEKAFLILAIFFMIICAFNVLLNRFTDYRLNYEFWSPIPASLILFGLFGLMAFCFLFIKTKNAVLRVVYSLVALVVFYYLSVFASLGYEDPKTYHLETTTVHVLEYRFIFDGEDIFFKQDNWLWSHYVAEFENGEDLYTSYSFDGDIMTATIIGSGDNQEVYVIDFSE